MSLLAVALSLAGSSSNTSSTFVIVACNVIVAVVALVTLAFLVGGRMVLFGGQRVVGVIVVLFEVLPRRLWSGSPR